MLRSGEKVAEVVRVAGISRSTGDRLKLALKDDRGLQLGKLLDPVNNRAFRRSVISKNKYELIKERIKFSESSGFEFSTINLKIVMSQMVTDEIKGFRATKRVPRDFAVRTWHAWNLIITYRAA